MKGIKLTIDTPEFERLADELARLFDPAARTKISAGAIRKALPTVAARLKALTPDGPTGNLKRAVGSKVVEYPRDGNAVGIVGYQQAGTGRSRSAAGGTVRIGPDRAFHQWWIEKGGKKPRIIDTPTPPRSYQRKSHSRGSFSRTGYTMTRNGKQFRVSAHQVSGHAVTGHAVKETTPTYYASSFRELQEFKIERFRLGEKGFVTKPAYDGAFFKRSKTPINLGQMRAGGVDGRPPLATAYDETRATVTEIIQRELALEIGRALTSLQRLAS